MYMCVYIYVHREKDAYTFTYLYYTYIHTHTCRHAETYAGILSSLHVPSVYVRSGLKALQSEPVDRQRDQAAALHEGPHGGLALELASRLYRDLQVHRFWLGAWGTGVPPVR